jgi:carbamoyltransferase
MYILGISGYSHESSAALIKDGMLKVFIEEERLNREKHTCRYPALAIEACLRQEGITIKDVDYITFFWKPLKEITGNLAHVLRYFPASLNLLRAPSGGGELSAGQRIKKMFLVGGQLRRQFGLSRAVPVNFIEHHLCHAASAFFVSPFDEAAILTIDGRGESASTVMAVGRKNKIFKIGEIKVPHSLGHLYAAVTDYLGFAPFYDEWKVMGMSAYGKDTYLKDFQEVIRFSARGEYLLNLDFFQFHTHGSGRWVSDKFIQRFGARRVPGGEYTQHCFDIAFALQKTVEKAGVHLAQGLYEKTGLPNLCMSGGVLLNCLMNKFIIAQTPFKNIFIQPIANDAGASLGSALYYYHQVRGNPRQFIFDLPYWGPEFSDGQIEAVLQAKGIPYRRVDNIARTTAAYIAQGKIVGWFQGRMEAGPRALGHRSIVADPTRAEMKSRLNQRVKKREFFRPFAPSVLEEKAQEYFELPKKLPSPYMIIAGNVRAEKKDQVPAVTHADGTARVHTVSRAAAPQYWDLINEFGKLTGVYVLLNTSFNENEPIVCTPEDAADCFLKTDLDVLSIGNCLAIK